MPKTSYEPVIWPRATGLSWISLELCVWAFVGLWFEHGMLAHVLCKINPFNSEGMCVSSEVCVCVCMFRCTCWRGGGENWGIWQAIVKYDICAGLPSSCSLQGIMGKSVEEGRFLLRLGVPHSGETSCRWYIRWGYLGILRHPQTLPFSFFLARSLCPGFFRTNCQYQTTSQSHFLSKKCIVLLTFALSMFPLAAEIRWFERKDLQTGRKLRAGKANEILRRFAALQTLHFINYFLQPWDVCF